jgi:hypothetical protein
MNRIHILRGHFLKLDMNAAGSLLWALHVSPASFDNFNSVIRRSMRNLGGVAMAR